MATTFLSEEEQQQIIKAIKSAEQDTSGEIKVHIEEECPDTDPVQRAIYLFEYLALHKTALRNGVLFYLAYEDRKFAVIGDKGIDEVVTAAFWDTTKDILRNNFSQQKFTEGMCAGIEEIGRQLKKYFPYHQNDTNEIADDISFG